MVDRRNFLLGHVQQLTTKVPPPPRGMDKDEPYTFETARNRLLPMVAKAVAEIDSLPDRACPDDEVVAVLTLHPQFLAKSYFPEALLRELRLETVGSRPVSIKAQETTRVSDPALEPSTQLFVAGPRDAFRSWSAELPSWSESTRGASDLTKIETFTAFMPTDKLRPSNACTADQILLEVALHASSGSRNVLRGFNSYARFLGAEPDFDRRLHAGGLCFLPVRAYRDTLEELAKFSFLRVARAMSRLRALPSFLRSSNGPRPFLVKLPEGDAVDPQLRVALFDGGVEDHSHLAQWTESFDCEGVGEEVDEALDHGSAVTSAVLFGALSEGSEIEQPYARVDHYRVFDVDTEGDEDLFDVLRRIKAVLQANKYEFVNLSIGPEREIEDDDIHPWTAVLDELFSEGATLATIAVGNSGENQMYNRVQVPSDCVNGLAIGATDTRASDWRRASYSSIGPGRSPGVVKPDAVAFGGSDREMFWVMDDQSEEPYAHATKGTSFAAPATLRIATGIRAHFGAVLGTLAIKALLIHSADAGEERRETGWGCVPANLDDIVVCPEGTARIVYQGELTPGSYLRARIPIPSDTLPGNVSLRATLCYATKIDSHHPGNYTRAGVGITFRPHSLKFDPKAEDPANPATDTLFKKKDYATERELRHNAHKWETTLHAEKVKRGSSLHEPTLDIHYNAREGSAPSREPDQIRYALIISVTCLKAPDLYDQVVRAFPTQIRPLQPIIQIPIQTRA